MNDPAAALEMEVVALRAELAQAHEIICQVASGLKALLDIPVSPHDDLLALVRREADAAGVASRCGLTACRRRRACQAPERGGVACLRLWPARAVERFLTLSDGIAFAAQCAEARRRHMAAMAGPALDRWAAPDASERPRHAARRRCGPHSGRP